MMLQMVNGCPLTKNEKWFFVSLDSNGMDYYYKRRKISAATTTIWYLNPDTGKTWYLLKSYHWWFYTYWIYSVNHRKWIHPNDPSKWIHKTYKWLGIESIIVIVRNVWQMYGFKILISMETVTDCDKSKLLSLLGIWNMFTWHSENWNGIEMVAIWEEYIRNKTMQSRQNRTEEKKDRITAAEKSATKCNKIHDVIHQSFSEFNSIFFLFVFVLTPFLLHYIAYCLVIPWHLIMLKQNSVAVLKTHQSYSHVRMACSVIRLVR